MRARSLFLTLSAALVCGAVSLQPVLAQSAAPAASSQPAAPQAAGTVTVVAVGKKGKAFKDPVQWEVRSAAGEVVGTGSEPTQEFSLPAGRYSITGHQGELSGQQTLTVESGKTLAVKVVMTREGAPATTASTATTGGAAATPTVMPATGAQKIRLVAIVGTGAKPLKDKVAWTVRRIEANNQPGAVIANVTESSPQVNLDPGTYQVVAKYGDAEVADQFTLQAGQKSQTVNLNVGTVRLNMIPNAGAPAVTQPVVWEVYRYTRGAPLPQNKVAAATAPSTSFILPAGNYVVRALYEGTASEMVVPLTAGYTYKYTFNLYAGQAGITAVSEKGGAFKDPVQWEVRRAGGAQDLLATSSKPSDKFMLREGTYVVTARQGSLIGQETFAVKAGKTQNVKVTMRQGTAAELQAIAANASAATPQAGTQPTQGKAASAAVTRTAPAAQPTATASAAPATTQAAATAQPAAEQTQPQAQAAQTAAVPAGSTTETAQPAQAAAAPAAETAAAPAAAGESGTIRLSAISKKGKPFREKVQWEVRADGQTEVLAKKNTAAPEFDLPAGTYVVTAKQGSYEGQQRFEVAPGKTFALRVYMTDTAEQAANETQTQPAPAVPGASSSTGG